MLPLKGIESSALLFSLALARRHWSVTELINVLRPERNSQVHVRRETGDERSSPLSSVSKQHPRAGKDTGYDHREGSSNVQQNAIMATRSLSHQMKDDSEPAPAAEEKEGRNTAYVVRRVPRPWKLPSSRYVSAGIRRSCWSTANHSNWLVTCVAYKSLETRVGTRPVQLSCLLCVYAE